MPAPYYPFDRTTRRSSVLTGDGVTTDFGPSAFKVADVADVEVWRKLSGEAAFSKMTSGVSVAKTGSGFSTFTVTFAAAVATTTQFYYQSRRLHERSTAINKAQKLDVQALDLELTKMGTILQEQYRELESAVKAQPGVLAPSVPADLVNGNLLAAGPMNTLVDAGVTAAKVAATVLLAASLAAGAPLVGVKAFGAVGNGVTDDKAVLDTASVLDGGAVYLPPGVWKYGDDDTGGNAAGKRFYGPGVAKTGANKRARSFGYLNAAPAYFGDTGSVVTAFNGDFSKSLDVREFRVSGATTLGDPTSGYYQKHETAAIYSRGYMGATAGKNNATDWTDGRTGWSFRQDQMDHFGQGDMTAWTVGVNVWNNKAGATHFLAQPAGNVMGGGVTAWVDHVNIVIGEFYVNGQTYDVNGTGFAIHLNRNNAAGAQEVYWRGVSILSTGTQPIDFAFGARGKMRRGLSLELGDFGTGQAAVSMAKEQAIVFNSAVKDTISANALASGFKVLDTTGDAKILYSELGSINSFLVTKPIIASGQLSSNGANGTNRGLNIQSSGVHVWRLLADGTSDENFKLSRIVSGSEVDQPIYIERMNGNMRIGVAAGQLGFYGAAGATKQTISGSRGGNAALADLLTKLASIGIITNSTSA